VNGLELWRGPSMVDGAPIVVLASLNSTNRATGPMVQTWIVLQDTEPHAAVLSGADRSICGDCRHRGRPPSKGRRGRIRTCYVAAWQAPREVWGAWKRGKYPPAVGWRRKALAGRPVRIGSYGDPGSAPLGVWANLVRSTGGEVRTGYTHLWRQADPRLARYCMASVDSPAEMAEAAALGWRTFRTSAWVDGEPPKLPGEIWCPKDRQKWGVTCLSCQKCDGGSAGSHVVTRAHGGAAVAHWRGDGIET
jgi:hypothetical protein